MDRKELNKKLRPFIQKAESDCYPLDFCLEEAYPGDNATSYILKVKATWIDEMSCSEAISTLSEILWETVDSTSSPPLVYYEFIVYICKSKLIDEVM
ncbi:MAG: hypothetical protein ACK5IQ_04375 [Bacteroidales bacterium]